MTYLIRTGKAMSVLRAKLIKRKIKNVKARRDIKRRRYRKYCSISNIKKTNKLDGLFKSSNEKVHKKRITINVNGASRTVLTIIENPNNYDLNFHITGGGATYKAKTLQELVSPIKPECFNKSDKYITVHNGTDSKKNNMIKRTINYLYKPKETSVQVTGAIKTDNLFTPALFRICGDLRQKRYLSSINKANEEEISLGEYDPEKNQLRFMVVISDKNKPFMPNEEHPSNNLTLTYSCFSITLIWSYLNQPSHPQAIDFFLSTTNETGPIAGFDWWQIYNMYTDFHMASANEYFKVYSDDSFRTP